MNRRDRVRAAVKKHKRAISPIAARPHACMCGWTGSGKVGDSRTDHLTDIVLHAVDFKAPAAECPAPSLETVAIHRAAREDLCAGCDDLVRTLA